MRAKLGQPCISMISSRTISIFCCCAQVRYSFTDLILQSRSIYYCTSISILRLTIWFVWSGICTTENHVFFVGENLIGKFRIRDRKIISSRSARVARRRAASGCSGRPAGTGDELVMGSVDPWWVRRTFLFLKKNYLINRDGHQNCFGK